MIMDISRDMLAGFAALEPTDTAVYHAAADGRLETLYLSWNIPALLHMTREEYLKITEKDAMDLTLPADRKGLGQATLRCLQTGAPFDYYYRVFHKVKGFEWVHVHAHLCGQLDGRPLIQALFANMTEEGGIYQEILNASDRKVFVIDRNTHEILYANERALTDASGHMKSILNQTCYAYLHDQDAPCPGCFLKTITKSVMEEVTYDAPTDRWEQTTRRLVNWCGHESVLLYIKDITEEKNTELSVERYRQMYADATQEANLIVWTYLQEKHQVVMLWDGYTKDVCQKYGVTQVIEHVPESLLPYVAVPDREAFRGLYQAIDGGAGRSECEFRFQLPGQKQQQYERAVAKVIYDEKGHKLGVYCFGQNITTQKQEEAKYQHACAELEKAHLYSLGTFHLNLTKNICLSAENLAVESWRKLEHRSVDEFFSGLAEMIVDAQIREKFLRRFDRIHLLHDFSVGTEKVSIEYPAIARDGIRRWREGMIFLMQNPRTGDVEGITFAMDIDAKKHGEFVIEKLIHENFDYLGIIHPEQQTFEFISRRPWITYGKVGAQLDYNDCSSYVAKRFSDPEERETFQKIVTIDRIRENLAADGRCSVSYLMTTNGKTRYSRLTYSWLEQPGGDILVYRTDITDAYEQEQARLARMQEALYAADRANEEKSTFLSTMSHDLRTPLNGVLSFADFALKEKDPEKKQEYLQKISYSGRLLYNLVNDTLELSRIESGKMVVEPELVSSMEVSGIVIESLRPSAEEKGITLTAGPFSDRYLYVDKLKYQKLWINLISNAIKYTPRGGTVHAFVEVIDPPVNGRNRRMIVEDNGIGMSREFMSRMFEPFSQENRPEAGGTSGTGLGLAIVRRIVDLLGGSITVHSELNRGTRFELEMPVQTAEGPAEKKEAATPEESVLSGRCVLLCEDNLLNQEIAATLLKSRGMQVDCAENGAVGLQLFRKSAPGYYSAILMDLRMPVMDGCRAAEAVRAEARPDEGTIPILAMTADAFEESIQQAKQAGMNGYLTKPVIPDRMFAELLRVIT